MSTKGGNRVYFIGIGGIGMSALARHFHSTGWTVSGYDKTETELTRQLSDEGIRITYSDTADSLDPDVDLVVYTPAIPSEHVQLNYYQDRSYVVKKRAEVLGAITNRMQGLAVAGSHGKTSTSAILNHILQTAGLDCAAFLGGIAINYNTNYIPGQQWAIAEADEFDRSFHHLCPQAAIITSVDTDHLDVYGDYGSIKQAFGKFATQVKDTLVCNEQVPQDVINEDIHIWSYGWDAGSDYHPSKLTVEHGCYAYDVRTPDGVITDLLMKGGGRHNVENSIGAIALAKSIGISDDPIRSAIASYKGVKRRFEIHIQRTDMVYIDDYAHHPKEIEVTLQTARELYPGRRLTVVFQPHLFSRTRDLSKGLAAALSLADEVVLMDIYPARELPIEGVDSGVIYRLLTNTGHLTAKNQVITKLNAIEPDLLITIGAGDIDTLVEPIIKNFNG